MDADCVQWGVDPCPGSAINNGTMGPATMAMAPGLGDEDHPDGEVLNRIASQSFEPSRRQRFQSKPWVGAAGRIAAWAAKTIGSFAADGVGAKGSGKPFFLAVRRSTSRRMHSLSRLLISRAFWVAPFQRCPPRGLLSVTARLVVFAPRGLSTSATIVAIRSGFTSLISHTSSPRSTADPLPSSLF